MTTGLFSTRRTSRQGIEWKRAAARTMRERLDIFADLLADGLSPKKASIDMGFSGSYGRIMLAKIRAGLGWQAQ